MKPDRKKIFDKYGGKCAFCGCELSKGWHTWDVEPIRTVINPDGSFGEINTEEGNLMPACKPCGSLRIRNYNKKMNIEEFRAEVAKSFEFLRHGGITATSYGRAIRFGLIVETGKELKFYFETIQERQS